jgi:hypothetical protein
MDQLTPQDDREMASISGIVKEIDGHRLTLTTGDGEMLADLSALNEQAVTINIFDRIELLGEKIGDEFKVSQIAGTGKEKLEASLSSQDAMAPSPDKMKGTQQTS